MLKMQKLSWYAPALRAVRVAIAEYERSADKWPSSPADLGAREIKFSYRQDGAMKDDTLTTGEFDFTLKGFDGTYARYDLTIRGVAESDQEIGRDEIDGRFP